VSAAGILACAVALLVPPWAAAEELSRELLPSERARLSVSRLERPPLLDEFLDTEPPADLAGQLTRIEGFTQREPEDGVAASQATRVYLGYDDRNFYAVFLAFDAEPEKIRARLARRENMFGDEIVEVQLDTFNDERRAFTFIANPFGVQWDAIWTETGGFDESWDTVWQSKGRLTDWGYVVLFTIPFESLRFSPSTEQTWGLILVRDIPRNNESSFWPRVSNRIEGRLNQAATLTGLSALRRGQNIWLIPYATSRSYDLLVDDGDTSAFVSEDFDSDAGMDGKLVIKDSLALDLTFNPDFSQVESDQPQVTVNQRFEVFFPEKRPFFLENANYFETPFDLLFTRRIADPRVGGRLTGKLGPYSLGAMVIDDEAPGKLVEPGRPGAGERAWFGVFRLSRDLLQQSNLGVLFTAREFGSASNRVGGLDGRFKIGTNWETQFHAVHSDTRPLPEEDGAPVADRSDEAYSLVFNRSGRKLNVHLDYEEIGPDFNTDAGFVRRNDIRDLHGRVSWDFRPEGRRLISWGPQLFVGNIWDYDGLRLDETRQLELDWELRGQTRFALVATQAKERLRPKDFPELDEPRDFSTDYVRAAFSTQYWMWLSINGGITIGDGINFRPPEGQPPGAADRIGGDLGLTLRLGRRTRIDGTFLYTELSDPSTDRTVFTNQIFRTRLSLQFNTRLSLRAILQYDETDPTEALTDLEPRERINGDLLLTYLINPWTALYLGYNTNYENVALVPGVDGDQVERVRDDLFNNAEQLFFKVSYLFRL